MRAMPSRRCKRIFAALSEFLDGDLPARNCRELERHLAGCKPCQAYLESLKITAQACREYGEWAAPAPSKALLARIRAQFREAVSRRPHQYLSRRGKTS
jgi:RNA polymerase sigma-70 factor, ECF subfamily